jgi:hypothetical protein
LNGVILDHARMLKRNGWDYDILAIKNFNQRDLATARAEGISVKAILPQTVLVDYGTHEEPRLTTGDALGFEDQASLHLNGGDGTIGYLEALEPYDTICSHDIMFLSWHLPQNAALRKCIEKWPERNWLNWIHSGPSQRPDGTCYPSTLRYQAAENSTYVFLNERQRHDCALMLECNHDRIAVVYNSRDPRDLYSFCPETNALVDAYDLLNSEILQIYPFSTPRWSAKGVHKLAAVFGQWKALGARVKLVLVNAHANSECDKVYVDEIERQCRALNLDVGKDVVLTSRWAEEREAAAKKTKDKDAERQWREWRHCVPHRVVRELTMLANVFVFPSESECCSLIQAEAAQSGKFMVLNSEFEAMSEFAVDGTLTFPFTGNDPSANPEFYACVAREAWSKLQTETAILNATKARTTVYNRDWIWRRQLEPLLWRKYSSRLARGSRRHVQASPPVTAEVPPGGARRHPAGGEAVIRLEAVTRPRLILPAGVAERLEAEKAVVMPTTVGPDCKFDAEFEAMPSDWDDPQPGQACPIYGECSTDQKAKCYEQAGHCLMKDEQKVEVAK